MILVNVAAVTSRNGIQGSGEWMVNPLQPWSQPRTLTSDGHGVDGGDFRGGSKHG